jgi:hypothetical protein
MPIGELLSLLLVSLAFLGAARVWRERFWLIVGLPGPIVLAVVVVRDGINFGRLTGSPSNNATTIAGLVLAAMVSAEVMGLPHSLVLRLGIGWRDRRRVFDEWLVQLRNAYIAGIRVAQLEPDHRTEALAVAARQVGRVRALRAPDRAWGTLRDDIADWDERWIDLIRSDASVEQLADHRGTFEPLLVRWLALRGVRRADAAVLTSPRLRRRNTAAWLLTFAITGALLAFAYLR